MAHVVVQALSRVHGLRYGEVARIELTPVVEALIENQKLAVVKEADEEAPAAQEAPAAEPPTKPTRKRAAPPKAEEDTEDTAAKSAPRKSRRSKETPAPEEG